MMCHSYSIYSNPKHGDFGHPYKRIRAQFLAFFSRKEVNNHLSADYDTLKEWFNQITSGIIRETRYSKSQILDSKAKGVIHYPYEYDRKDDYASPTFNGYDFDASARSLNAKYHRLQPDTAINHDGTSDKLGSKGEREVPVPLNQSVRTLEDLVTNFEVTRLPDYDNMPMSFVGRLIFTRPSLYLKCTGLPANLTGYSASDNSWSTDPQKNYYQMATESLTAGFASDTIGRTLLHPLTYLSTSPYMPLFTSKALNYTTADISLKTIEKGTTFYGHTIKYGHYNEEHKAGGSITLEFMNDRYWSVLKTCYMWMSYIYMVSKTNVIRPYIGDQTGGILDYAGSIYYLVTDSSNSRLVYWEKLTGVFPKMVPFSLFTTEDNQKFEDKVSIEFDYGIKSDPCDPNILMDINVLTMKSTSAAQQELNGAAAPGGRRVAGPGVSKDVDFSSGLARFDNYHGGIGPRSNVEASRPIIRQRIDGRGNKNYYLEWFRRNGVPNSSGGPVSAAESK